MTDFLDMNEVEAGFKSIGLEWMSKGRASEKFDKEISLIKNPSETLDLLSTAQWHYMDIIGVTESGLFDINSLSKEKEELSHLLKTSEDGQIVFEEHQCISFMSSNYNLPLELCAAYVCGHKW